MAEIFQRKTIRGEYSRKTTVSVGVASAHIKVFGLYENVYLYIHLYI